MPSAEEVAEEPDGSRHVVDLIAVHFELDPVRAGEAGVLDDLGAVDDGGAEGNLAEEPVRA